MKKKQTPLPTDFPAFSHDFENIPINGDYLDIVGNCPTCGAPIYGDRRAVVGMPLEIRRTCICSQGKSIQDLMRTT